MRRARIITTVFGILLAGILVAACLLTPSHKEEGIAFKLGRSASAVTVNAWLDSSSNHYYLFLPSFAVIDSLTYNTEDCPVTIGNTTYHKGDYLSTVDTGKTYRLTCERPRGADGATKTYLFTILQSTNTTTLFVEMKDDIFDKVNHDRDTRGPALVSFLSPTGTPSSAQGLRATIKGRGCSSWRQPKKSYKLVLNSPDSLLGMAPASKWILVSNSFDETNLKNKIVLDFARWLDYGWTPDARFVDLYVNNNYLGLYLLSEDIETMAQKQPGTHLFKIDFWESPSLRMAQDQYIQLVGENPQNIFAFKEEIRQLREAIHNADRDSLNRLPEVMDIHSWACKYLIDEVFANYDMWRKSNYFYCLSGKPAHFYGGPAWDYDIAWHYPANSLLAAGKPEWRLYHTLMQNARFARHTKAIYTSRCNQYVQWLVDRGIDSMATLIHSASHMNSLRWQRNFDQDRPHEGWIQPSIASPDSLKTYLATRRRFLDRHWEAREPYRQITINMPMAEGNIYGSSDKCVGEMQ
ncbi:MAG: CotH kinase family protein [Bacteroidales bacterium]|nr:CotH kinase family protein [Bacteroidales bacterium]